MGAGSIIMSEDGKILTLIRPDGEYDLPKGQDDPEDFDDFVTAQRETWEEAHIWITEEQILGEVQGERLTLFVIEHDPTQPPDLSQNPDFEHVDWAWVSLDDFKENCLSYLVPLIEQLK